MRVNLLFTTRTTTIQIVWLAINSWIWILTSQTDNSMRRQSFRLLRRRRRRLQGRAVFSTTHLKSIIWKRHWTAISVRQRPISRIRSRPSCSLTIATTTPTITYECISFEFVIWKKIKLFLNPFTQYMHMTKFWLFFLANFKCKKNKCMFETEWMNWMKEKNAKMKRKICPVF